jgi:hypothetical protein
METENINSKLTKEELIKQLKDLEGGDQETSHIKADELLIEFINDPEVTDAFECIDKWYS